MVLEADSKGGYYANLSQPSIRKNMPMYMICAFFSFIIWLIGNTLHFWYQLLYFSRFVLSLQVGIAAWWVCHNSRSHVSKRGNLYGVSVKGQRHLRKLWRAVGASSSQLYCIEVLLLVVFTHARLLTSSFIYPYCLAFL